MLLKGCRRDLIAHANKVCKSPSARPGFPSSKAVLTLLRQLVIPTGFGEALSSESVVQTGRPAQFEDHGFLRRDLREVREQRHKQCFERAHVRSSSDRR